MLTAGQERRGLRGERNLVRLRQRVHPAVDRDEPSFPQSTLDRALAHARGKQLRAREPGPLTLSDRLDPSIERIIGSDPYPALSEQRDRPCR